MNLDDIIKNSYEQEAVKVELSQNKEIETLNYILSNIDKSQGNILTKVTKKFRSYLSFLRISEAFGVIIILFITFVLPIIITQNKQVSITNISSNPLDQNKIEGNKDNGINMIDKEVPKGVLDNIKIKNEEIKDKDRIQKEITFKIEKPTIDLGDLKEVDVTLKKEIINEDDPKSKKTYDYYTEEYKGNNEKQLIIVQSNAVTDTPLNPINLTEKGIIKGVEAFICESNGGWTQVMFIKDSKFYNVCGSKIPKSELIRIAESLA
ncbi:DUF4367 domain-containing protein [Candidatus Clostridium radicumherbarum]|uniref:DUF4367 domain-containing protein n=1 Tax=Candidatus Clostridium radicumherbarum TaxID=3381662 RepID=A0ABW8TVG5_9CLOT